MSRISRHTFAFLAAVIFWPALVLAQSAVWLPTGATTGPIYYNGGNVGIGTGVSPAAPLHVAAPNAVFELQDSNGTNAGFFANVASDWFAWSINRNPATGAFLDPSKGVAAINLFIGAGNPAITFYTGAAANPPVQPLERMRLDVSGNLSIGTTSAGGNRLVVAQDNSAAVPSQTVVEGATNNLQQLLVGYNTTADYGSVQAIHQGSSATPLLLNPAGGTVAINKSSASSGYALDVNGNANFSGTVTGANIHATYQDVAEWVPASERMTAGTVVVLNASKSNEVMPSRSAYDTTVAGVVSAHPGLILGEASTTKAQIATTGRVKVKVDATKHAVAVGDLLVTSNKPGTAMVSEPIDLGGVKIHRPGTLIGKALEPLATGEGEVLVLLSLQ